MDATTTTLVPCNHPMCYDCAHKWIHSYDKTVCPTCKRSIVSPPSKEGDIACEGVLVATLSDNRHMGITVSTASGGGVRILRTHPGDIADTIGLRAGWIITHINTVPQRNHRHFIRVIEEARENRVPLRMDVRRAWSLNASAMDARRAFAKCFRRPM